MTLRRVVSLSFATLVLLLAGQHDALAAAPLDEHGLVLPNGRGASPPTATAWGTPIDPAVRSRLESRAAALHAEPGRVWISWDVDRGAPRELIVTGVAAPGAGRSAGVARMFARLWLARHIELLAPGSSVDDFELVSNDLSAGLRSLGFRQLHDGVPVVGGQLSLIFSGDALVFVGSQAQPHVTLQPTTAPLIEPTLASARAREWLAADYPTASLRPLPGAERLILPVHDNGQVRYHDVLRVEVRSDAPPGHWAVYVDARTGAPVAREQLLRSVGTVRFNVPTRHPLGAREDAIAPELSITENGMQKLTNAMGQFNLANNPAAITTSVTGPRVAVDNAQGSEASTLLMINDGGTGVWNAANTEFVDAQLSAFVHASRAKAYVRAIDPGFGFLDEALPVRVNLNGSCNAFADDQGINFLREDNQCANTARLADVVAHEFGHRVHAESLVMGVGAFDGALSEGVSDYLASTIVDDSAMGRGFFKSDAPLREIDPDGTEAVWPEDIDGDPHITGLIIAGALWDLRTELIADMGAVEGRAHADMLYYQATRRAIDIPSMYAQVVIADDDNGDISDGSPNICLINQVFEAHGLLAVDDLSDIQLDLDHTLDGYQVSVVANTPMFAGCSQSLESLTLRWRLRDDPNTIEDLPMTLVDGVWVATIPSQSAGTVVEYRIEGSYGASELARPLNLADPWYQAYFGGVERIYCLDPNADLDAWTLDWMWSFGPLMPGGGDPAEPYDDDGVQLSMHGSYNPNAVTSAISPMIDISGYTDVRLHYWRWLSVEDHIYDHGNINANGQTVWTNAGTMGGQLQHLDGEWRFHDVPLTEFIPDGDVELEFEIESDPGLEFGGWNLDALCVVAVGEIVCGDGQIDGPEQCDDGNTLDGDGCDAQCQLEEPTTTTGDGDGDGDGSPGDGDGSPGDGDGDTTGSNDSTSDTGTGESASETGTDGPGELTDDSGCNCSSPADAPRPFAGAWLLALAGLGLIRRKRD